MGLLSIFKRGDATRALPPAADDPAGDVQRVRARARQRLVGAAVLVAVGVIGFPLVFETQPRPISVDIPIDIPRKEGAPPLLMPAAPESRDRTVSEPTEAAASSGSAVGGAVPGPREEGDREARDGGVLAAPAASPAGAVLEAVPRPPPRLSPASGPGAQPRPAPNGDGARAKALLEGEASVTVAAARFVVQVGAFADAVAARDTRAKVERLGLKTYTQVVETSAGPRIRVRIGPFTSRDEADRARAAARSAGLAADVLTL